MNSFSKAETHGPKLFNRKEKKVQAGSGSTCLLSQHWEAETEAG